MHLDVDVTDFQYGPSDKVLNGVRFGLRRGETLAVLGGSGCGKSTLLRVIAGLLPAKPEHRFTGRVTIDGMTPEAYRASGRLAFMFQSPTLFPNRTVYENVMLPLELLGRQRDGRADELIEMVGLGGHRDYLPRQLSGGMRTRVALARSFVVGPEVLLLDEPFAALDLSWKQELYRSLADLKTRYDTTVVMVTHDLQEAMYNANRVLVLGRRGSPLQMLEVDRPLPRPFPFQDTVSEFTGQLARLGHLLTNDALRHGTSREDALRLLDEREALLADPAAHRGNGRYVGDFDMTPIREYSNDPEINERLYRMWRVAPIQYRLNLLWDLLNYPDLDPAIHREIAEVVLDNLDEFNRMSVPFYGTGVESLLDATVERLDRDGIPASKKWIYLCHLPAVPDVERAEALLLAAASEEDPRFVYPFASEVARTLLTRLDYAPTADLSRA